ncbi:MAG: hypothetical protein EU541_07385 [Promethearchaeota archaeon]|nr:MAG: hypothetical protein EU541_07385 [Candidatus Lokiarchaeota archaeon]
MNSMNKSYRYLVLFICFFGELLILFLFSIILNLTIRNILLDFSFYLLLPFIFLSLEEVYVWAKQGKRSEFSDIVFIFFFLFLIYFLTKDFLTSIMGAFSIYLWVGVWELKDYPVINKILFISLITYTVIFIAGLISFYIHDPIVLNTAFSFSFWIILILGFILFGRKYIVVWRFMSPQYLTLFLYIIGWLIVVFIDRYTFINFLDSIYFVLILVNILTYCASGVFINRLLGIKKVKNEELNKIVSDVKVDIGIKGKVKRGFGKYPILNAMAYGPFFDRRIAIIAEDINKIPKEELKGIVAHELAHTKGNHTLLLALLTIGDLIFRMIVGLPATMYDYTFGNPQIPFVGFLLINIGIYIILYFFVRVLEGYADLNAKNAGYKNQLAKALYTLESFYATGREFGLNTMLLCKEKITRENKLLDYINTAQYVNKTLIKPSRLSLISNFLDSHPPTYYRLSAILGDNLDPFKEAFLPVICIKRSKQKKYANLFKKERSRFLQISNKKIKERFNIDNVPAFFERIGIKENYKLELDQAFIFKNLITGKLKYAIITDLHLTSNFSSPLKYKVFNPNSGKIELLNPFLFEKKRVSIGNQYKFKDSKKPLKLKDITFGKNFLDGKYIFRDNDDIEIAKKINDTKLPIPLDFIDNFKNKTVFLKTKGILKILNCVNIQNQDSDYILELKNSTEGEKSEIILIPLKEIIIHPYRIQTEIRKGEELKEEILHLFQWIKNHEIRTHFYLKKPVNNTIVGKIIQIKQYNHSNSHSDSEITHKIKESQYTLEIENIFGQIKSIELNSLDFLSFKYETGTIEIKKESSIFSKLFYSIYQYLKPAKIKF